MPSPRSLNTQNPDSGTPVAVNRTLNNGHSVQIGNIVDDPGVSGDNADQIVARVLTVPPTGSEAALTTRPIRPTYANASVAQLGAGVTSQRLLAANANRRGARIFNYSSSALIIGYGHPAVLTEPQEIVQPNSVLVVPDGFTGEVHGIWANQIGAAVMTEFTP